MGNDDDLRALLRRFGHNAFRPGQEPAIRALLASRSALALFPTGAGKSLCYQLPALRMDGVTLVISPLIALMKDQVEGLRARGIAAARLDSSLDAEAARAVVRDLRRGRLRLLYVAPERLLNAAFLDDLRRAKVAMMAVDEAHCIAEWGHNFRPEYLRLARVARDLGIRPVLALTATATPETAREICAAFGIAAADRFETPFRRPNLEFRIAPCAAGKRVARLTALLRRRPGSAVVYVTLQRTAGEVAAHLKREGIGALVYHAGLPDEQRRDAQEAFMSGRVPVVVATIAFGMGIDKADIRTVVHFNMPKSLENYVQETGRAGRDGRPARCEWLACADDATVLENFSYGDTPAPAALRNLAGNLLRQGSEFDVSVYELSRSADIRPAVIETVLTYLELDGLAEPLGTEFAVWKFRLLQPVARILAGHPPRRRRKLERLLAASPPIRGWTSVSPSGFAEESGGTSDEIVRSLQELADAGDIELRPSHSRRKFRLTADASSAAGFADRMVALFADREAREIARLREVLDFAADRRCLSRALAARFGSTDGADCGRCTSCRDRRKSLPPAGPRPVPQSPPQTIATVDVAAIRALLAERHPALRAPRPLARFLCGIASPATIRDRLTRHDAFGMLERVPFAEVLVQARSMCGA